MGSHISSASPLLHQSSQRLPNTQQTLGPEDGADPLRGFNLAPPSAAVVGAGIAGVHTAYELGKLGFNVTVFDEKDDVAAGATQYSLPFVGVGLVKPFLSRVSLCEDFVKGLFPASCPSIITRDHMLNSIFSTPLHRWALARSRCTFNEDEIMFYTDNLSRLSHQTVTRLASRHPALQNHIRPGKVAVSQYDSQQGKTGNEKPPPLIPVTTAHEKPLMVDPVGWTRTLAAICRDQFNVRFALGETVEGFHTYLKYDVETTRTLRLSRLDPEDPSKRVYAEEMYDVVVLAAGAKTGALTSLTARLPVVGLSGVAVGLTNTAGGALDRVRKLFPSSANATESGSEGASLVVLSGPCSLFGYRCERGLSSLAPSMHNGSSSNNSGTASVTGSPAAPSSHDYHALTGLLSLDTTQASHPAAHRNLTRMEAFLRVMCDQELPLVEVYCKQPVGPGGPVAVTSYTRAFTPDGVPLVDHCGGAFNTFVCTGFGDQAMDFAPGSARILGQLVRHQAEILLREDASRQQALGLATMAAGELSSSGGSSTGRLSVLPLPTSRLQEAERDMQCLLNGVLPPDRDVAGGKGSGNRVGVVKRWLTQLTCSSVSSADAATNSAAASNAEGELPVQDWRINDLPTLPGVKQRAEGEFGNKDSTRELYFQGNPYSTNRFGGVVQKGFRDLTLHTPWSYVTAAETALFNFCDPLRQRLNRELSNLARRDNVPDFVRTFVYYNLYYDGDATEREQQESAAAKAARQRVLAMHESEHGRSAQLVEQSMATQAERDLRARKATANQLHVPGAHRE